jgi:hypothetical protein
MGRISVCRLSTFLVLGGLGLLLLPAAASAQYRPGVVAETAVGEDYHVEAAYGWWNATPELFVQSEALGILGTRINLIDDLGIEQHKLGKLDIVLRPAKKHRFLFERLPINYSTDAFPVTREFVFNGQRYTVGLPVTTNVNLTTLSAAYEYDFLYFARGFIGANVGVKYTNVDVDLTSPIGSEFVTAVAPVPAIGFKGRGYPSKNFAVDVALSFFRMPESLQEQIEGDGSYTDFDLHGTYNFTKNVGAQMGWRKTTIFYSQEEDTGDLKFSGLYFGGVVRF